jgi:hypothetical protein
MLRGTIRDHVTQRPRPMLRFFACGEDLSHEPAVAPGRSLFCRRGHRRRLRPVAAMHFHEQVLKLNRVACDVTATLMF